MQMSKPKGSTKVSPVVPAAAALGSTAQHPLDVLNIDDEMNNDQEEKPEALLQLRPHQQ